MLINIADIQKHRPIADNLDDERRIDPYIREVETLDVVPAIGAVLYKDLTEHPENHETLLNGGYYDNDTKYLIGLKSAIAMLTYARFLPNNSINVTPFGVKIKTSLDSFDVDSKEIYRQANEARNTGLAYLDQCIAYINASQCGNTKTTRNRKFKVIG